MKNFFQKRSGQVCFSGTIGLPYKAISRQIEKYSITSPVARPESLYYVTKSFKLGEAIAIVRNCLEISRQYSITSLVALIYKRLQRCCSKKMNQQVTSQNFASDVYMKTVPTYKISQLNFSQVNKRLKKVNQFAGSHDRVFEGACF